MPLFTDQVGRTVSIAPMPQRIISLVPSITELLSHLHLDKEVIGITKFCVHPQHWFYSKTRIGGTKDINISLIRSLQPQLIVASKEENVKEQVALLWNEFPTWVSDVADLPSALQMIIDIGLATGKAEASAKLAGQIRTAFKALPAIQPAIKAAYLIWRKPYMCAGGDTFIHHMLAAAGFRNVFAEQPRYPVIELDDLRASNCNVVLLSTEPYPFKEKHVAELAAALPDKAILLADGELFSWYGSRMLLAPAYFKSLQQAAVKMISGSAG